MKTIHKYPIHLRPIQTVMLPIGATILTIDVQHEDICLWAKVEVPDNDQLEPEMSPRELVIVGTGFEIRNGDNDIYLESVQLMHGALVYHAFERPYD